MKKLAALLAFLSPLLMGSVIIFVANPPAEQGGGGAAACSGTTCTGDWGHANVATITAASGLGTHADYNADNDTWQGHNYLNYAFYDFDDALNVSPDTYAGWTAAADDFSPFHEGGTFSNASDRATYGISFEVGGPSRSGEYYQRVYATDERGGFTIDNAEQNGQRLYYFYKFRTEATVDQQSGKHFRIWADNENIWHSPDCKSTEFKSYDDVGGQATFYLSDVVRPGATWVVLEQYYDPTATDISRDHQSWMDGATYGGDWDTDTDILTADPGWSGHTTDFPNMIDNAGRGCGTAGSFSYTDIFIDHTLRRVVISDASSWNHDTDQDFEIQIPITWSDTEITFGINAGRWTDEQLTGKYVYVIDDDDTQIAKFGPIP